MDKVLDGKVAIVTGSAGGIGRVYANALARAGASVVVADLNEGGAAEVAAHLGDDGLAAIGVRVDITDPDSAGAMAAAATAAFGGIDILVNNAALMAELPAAPLSCALRPRFSIRHPSSCKARKAATTRTPYRERSTCR